MDMTARLTQDQRLEEPTTTISRLVVPVRRTTKRTAKRAIDIAGAVIGLVVLSPLLALVAVAVRLDSPGPAVFRQARLGIDQQPFVVYKFRSMRVDADPVVHRQFLTNQAEEVKQLPVKHFKVINDNRVTRVGSLIRQLSIDELPQLVNVLRGEMSLVGPRPDMDYALEHYQPHHFRRFDVKPGITGLWQVSGRSRLSYLEMLDLDVEYADTWSIGLDLRILAKTLLVVAALDKAG